VGQEGCRQASPPLTRGGSSEGRNAQGRSPAGDRGLCCAGGECRRRLLRWRVRFPATTSNSGVLQRAGGSTARLPGRGQGMSAGDGRETLLGRGCPRLAEVFLYADGP
jgi:hypothetical protein